MSDPWRPTRRLPIDAAPPKYLRGLEALGTVGIAAGFLLLEALCDWLDGRAAEHAAGHGSGWLVLSIVFAVLAFALGLQGFGYGIKWRKTWLGKIALVIAPVVLAGVVVFLLDPTKH